MQNTRVECRTPDCNNYGNPTRGNLCNSCYQTESLRCLIKGCSHFGHKDTLGLCNRCSVSYQFCRTCKGFAKSLPEYLPNLQLCTCKNDNLNRNSVKPCKTTDCQNSGNDEQFGLCLTCSKLFGFCHACHGFSTAVPNCLIDGYFCICKQENTSMTPPSKRFECKTKDCVKYGIKETSGLCYQCACFYGFCYTCKGFFVTVPESIPNGHLCLCADMDNLNRNNVMTSKETVEGQPQGLREEPGLVDRQSQDCFKSSNNVKTCSESDCNRQGIDSCGGRCATCFTLFECVARNATPEMTPLSERDLICSVPGCSQIGSSQLDGRCYYCYKKQKKQCLDEHSTSMNRCTTPSCDKPVFRNCKCFECCKELGNPCIVDGCPYFGSPDFKGMCSECYNKINKIHLSRATSMPCLVTNTKFGPQQRNICSTPGCKYYGDPQHFNLCSFCFKKRPCYKQMQSMPFGSNSSTPRLSPVHPTEVEPSMSIPCKTQCGERCTVECFKQFQIQSNPALLKEQPFYTQVTSPTDGHRLNQRTSPTDDNPPNQIDDHKMNETNEPGFPPYPISEVPELSSVTSEDLFPSLGDGDRGQFVTLIHVSHPPAQQVTSSKQPNTLFLNTMSEVVTSEDLFPSLGDGDGGQFETLKPVSHPPAQQDTSSKQPNTLFLNTMSEVVTSEDLFPSLGDGDGGQFETLKPVSHPPAQQVTSSKQPNTLFLNTMSEVVTSDDLFSSLGDGDGGQLETSSEPVISSKLSSQDHLSKEHTNYLTNRITEETPLSSVTSEELFSQLDLPDQHETKVPSMPTPPKVPPKTVGSVTSTPPKVPPKPVGSVTSTPAKVPTKPVGYATSTPPKVPPKPVGSSTSTPPKVLQAQPVFQYQPTDGHRLNQRTSPTDGNPLNQRTSFIDDHKMNETNEPISELSELSSVTSEDLFSVLDIGQFETLKPVSHPPAQQVTSSKDPNTLFLDPISEVVTSEDLFPLGQLETSSEQVISSKLSSQDHLSKEHTNYLTNRITEETPLSSVTSEELFSQLDGHDLPDQHETKVPSMPTPPKVPPKTVGSVTSTLPKVPPKPVGFVTSTPPKVPPKTVGSVTSTPPKVPKTVGSVTSTPPKVPPKPVGSVTSTPPKVPTKPVGYATSTPPKVPPKPVGSSTSTPPKVPPKPVGSSTSTLSKVPPKLLHHKDPSTIQDSELKRSDSVKLSIVSESVSTLEGDYIICLWSKQMVELGPSHPVLQLTGPTGHEVLEPWTEFKKVVESGKVMETSAGTLHIGRILHCLCLKNSTLALTESLSKCCDYVKQSPIVIVPFLLCDVMYNNLSSSVQACLKLVSDMEKSKHTHSLKKVIVAVDNMEIKNKFNKKMNELTHCLNIDEVSVCQSCHRRPTAKLGTLSRNCDENCRWFCVDCLRRSREKSLFCQLHGPCLSPIGHENMFALLIAGQDNKVQAAEIFIRDAQRVAKTIRDPDIIGIREENLKLITTRIPGSSDDMKSKVSEAFTDFRQQMKGKEHSFFLLYFTGHNSHLSLRLGGLTDRITPKELRKELQSLDADIVVIILDCCYSAAADMGYNDDDFMNSLGDIQNTPSGNFVLVPKLWNLFTEDEEASMGDKKEISRVKQWASSVASEKSFFSNNAGHSLFTDCIINLLNGCCPASAVRGETCIHCVRYHDTAVEEDCVYLENLHRCVTEHVKELARGLDVQQHPQLTGSADDDVVIAFHLHQ